MEALEIFDTLSEHNAQVKEHTDGRVVLTSLYGSQNYGLDTDTSDVDSHSIVVPSFRGLCFDGMETSQIGDNIHYKDIRAMVKMWEKQSINFLEVMFTKFSVCDYTFSGGEMFHLFEVDLPAMREDIAHMNPMAFLVAAYGTIYNNCKTAINTGSNKKLARACYFYDMTKKYQTDMPFADVLRANEYERECYFTRRAMQDNATICNCAVQLMTEVNRRQDALSGQKFVVDTKTQQRLHDWLFAVLKEGSKR